MKNEEIYTDVDYTNDDMSEEYVVIDSDNVTVEDTSDYQEEYEEENENIDERLVEFQRIDWSRSETAISYGADLLIAMGKIESNKSALSSDSETNREKINTLAAKVKNFIDNMEKDIEKGEKNDKKNEMSKELALVDDAIEKAEKGYRKLKLFAKRKYLKHFTEAHTDNITEAEYNNFKDNLRELSSLIDIERENIKQEVKIYAEYLKMILPYYRTLEYLIEEGEKEAKSRKDYLDNEYGNRELDAFESLDYSLELSVVTDLNGRLKKLKDQLAMFKTQIYEANLTVNTDRKLMILNQEYIDITLPALESKGESMLKVKVQRERINTLISLDNMTNAAYQTTSKVITANIEDITQMEAEGTIKVDTMKELLTNIKKGVGYINDAEKLSLKLESDKAKLRDEFNKTISTSMLLGNAEQTAYLVEETSSVQTDGQQVGKRRVRK